MTSQTYRVQMQPKLPKGTLDKLWNDPENWRGAFYFCKNDPRNLVPKRVRSTGWTLNFAHPSAWIGVLVRMTVLAGLLIYLKNTGHDDWMFVALAVIVLYSYFDGKRKSSPDRYEEST